MTDGRNDGSGGGRAGGRCACGGVRFVATLPPRFVAHCHCENCRRAHGAAFVTWAGFREAAFRLDDPEGLVRAFASDTSARRRFCSRCGTPMLYDGPRWPGEVHVAVALFDDDLGVAPKAHVYADRAPSWCPIADALPRLGGASGTEPLD
ncbi:MAG: GFA family protein [Planctomycetota bacterium]